MSFRTVEIIGPAELHVKNGSLVIEKEIKEEKPAKVSEGTRKKKEKAGAYKANDSFSGY